MNEFIKLKDQTHWLDFILVFLKNYKWSSSSDSF